MIRNPYTRPPVAQGQPRTQSPRVALPPPRGFNMGQQAPGQIRPPGVGMQRGPNPNVQQIRAPGGGGGIPALPVLHPKPGVAPEMIRQTQVNAKPLTPHNIPPQQPPMVRKSMKLRCKVRILAEMYLSNGRIIERDTDVTFICSDGIVRAHKVILGTANKIFADMFEDDHAMDSVVNFPDVSTTILRCFLLLFYTDKIPLTEDQVTEVLEVFPTFRLSEDLFSYGSQPIEKSVPEDPLGWGSTRRIPITSLPRSYLVREGQDENRDIPINREGEERQSTKLLPPNSRIKKAASGGRKQSIGSRMDDDSSVNFVECGEEASGTSNVVEEWMRAVSGDDPAAVVPTASAAPRKTLHAQKRKLTPIAPKPNPLEAAPSTSTKTNVAQRETGEKPKLGPGGIRFIYICDKCEMMNDNLTKAQVHYERVCFPDQEVPFDRTVTRYKQGYYGQSKCPWCPKRFVTNFSWTLHTAQMHKSERSKFIHNNTDDTITCKGCLNGFSFPSDFEYHFTVAGNTCGPRKSATTISKGNLEMKVTGGVGKAAPTPAPIPPLKIKIQPPESPEYEESNGEEEEEVENDGDDYEPPAAKKVKLATEAATLPLRRGNKPGTKRGKYKIVKKIKKKVQVQEPAKKKTPPEPKAKPEMNKSLPIGRSSRIAKRRSQEAEGKQQFEPAECPLCGSVEDKIGEHIDKEHSDLNLNVIRVSDSALRCLRCQTSFAICDLVSHGAFCDRDIYERQRDSPNSPPQLTPMVTQGESKSSSRKSVTFKDDEGEGGDDDEEDKGIDQEPGDVESEHEQPTTEESDDEEEEKDKPEEPESTPPKLDAIKPSIYPILVPAPILPKQQEPGATTAPEVQVISRPLLQSKPPIVQALASTAQPQSGISKAGPVPTLSGTDKKQEIIPKLTPTVQTSAPAQQPKPGISKAAPTAASIEAAKKQEVVSISKPHPIVQTAAALAQQARPPGLSKSIAPTPTVTVPSIVPLAQPQAGIPPKPSTSTTTQPRRILPRGIGESPLDTYDYPDLTDIATLNEALSCRICGSRAKKLGAIADCYKSHQITRCPICFNTYTSRSKYLTHVTACHRREDNSLYCPICNESGFGHTSQLAIHQYNVHWLQLIRELKFDGIQNSPESTDTQTQQPEVEILSSSSATSTQSGSKDKEDYPDINLGKLLLDQEKNFLDDDEPSDDKDNGSSSSAPKSG